MALAKIGVVHDEGELDSLLHVLDVVPEDAGLDLEEFRRVLLHPSPMEEWANTLPLPQLLASCIPQPASSELPLRHIAALDEASLEQVQANFAVGLQKLLSDAAQHVQRLSVAGAMAS